MIINLLLHFSGAFVPDSNVEEREFGKIQTTAGNGPNLLIFVDPTAKSKKYRLSAKSFIRMIGHRMERFIIYTLNNDWLKDKFMKILG